MHDLVKYEAADGQLVQFTADDVRARLCPNIEEKELALVMGLCAAQKLNPFIKDVYIIKYGNSPASIVTSKEVFTKRANAHPDYEGFEAGVVYVNKRGEVCQREGSAVYGAAEEKLVGGWCRVYVKGRRPFYDEVTLAEYSTGKSGWAKMPATMIRKVALVHCLREAFPEEFQGLYSAEEMDKKVEEDKRRAGKEANSAPAPTPDIIEAEALRPEFVEMISDTQEAELNAKARTFADLRGVEFGAVYDAVMKSKTMQELGACPGEMFTAVQAAAAIALLSSWIEKAEAQAAAAQSFDAAEAQATAPAYETPLEAAQAAALEAISGAELAADDILF